MEKTVVSPNIHFQTGCLMVGSLSNYLRLVLATIAGGCLGFLNHQQYHGIPWLAPLQWQANEGVSHNHLESKNKIVKIPGGWLALEWKLVSQGTPDTLWPLRVCWCRISGLLSNAYNHLCIFTSCYPVVAVDSSWGSPRVSLQSMNLRPVPLDDENLSLKTTGLWSWKTHQLFKLHPQLTPCDLQDVMSSVTEHKSLVFKNSKNMSIFRKNRESVKVPRKDQQKHKFLVFFEPFRVARH